MKPKAFTLVELLVVIAIIGLLSTIVLISTKGLTERAKEVRKLSNRRQAIVYCTANPGFQVIAAPNPSGSTREYHVYCDSKGNMWSETLHTDMNTDNKVVVGGITTDKYWYGKGTFDPINLVDGTVNFFRWSGLDYDQDYDLLSETEPYFTVNDCNEVPPKYLHLFPACNVCAGLNYAGFAEGWRLPSQRLAIHDITKNCINSEDGNWCPYNVGSDNCCAPGRQLWDFGAENCNWNPDTCIDCLPGYDRRMDESFNYYLSSTQKDKFLNWSVNFSCARVFGSAKSYEFYLVRCFLGQWP